MCVQQPLSVPTLTSRLRRAATRRFSGSSVGTVNSRSACIVASTRINANRDPREKSIGNAITHKDVVKDRIAPSSNCLVCGNAIICIFDDFDRVGVVWANIAIHLSNNVLVEEQLAGVSDVSTDNCVVRKFGGAQVGDDMDVSSTTTIMAWKDGLKCCYSVLVGFLNASQGRVVQVCGVVAVAVAISDNTSVDSCGIAAVKQSARDLFAGETVRTAKDPSRAE